MKMRVSIARALVARPAALLMDEPFAALDESTRACPNGDLVAPGAAEKFTAIFVTHSVFESVFLSQRILVLSGCPGRLVADIANPAPYPRDDLYRTSPQFNEVAREVLLALKAGGHDADPSPPRPARAALRGARLVLGNGRSASGR